MDNSVAGEMEEDNVQLDNSSLEESTEIQDSKQASRSTSEATVVRNEQSDDHAEKDEQTEALIQAAARDIIEKIEKDRKLGHQASDPDYTGDYEAEDGHAEGANLTFGQDTELTYEDGTEMSYEGEERAHGAGTPDDGYDGSASSHHEDDVFSHGRTPSGGSNNTSDAQHTDEEARYSLTKEIADEVSRQQALNPSSQPDSDQVEQGEQGFFDQSCSEAEADTPMISRVPSYATTTTFQHPTPHLALNTHTTLNIPDPRSQSAIAMRALQMSSPAPSIFSHNSPMSRKRPSSSSNSPSHHLRSSPQPTRTVRKLGKATPRFAAPEDPLVLLHVTVLPLRWPHGALLENAPNEVLSGAMLGVKQAWKVLRDKLGEMVLERGVLIAHPQESYEMLEERLCAALELPGRPRARILGCGHYWGPDTMGWETETESGDGFCDSEDSEDGEGEFGDEGHVYCDVCCKEVGRGKFDRLNRGLRKKTFRVKVFASNGLMGSGAWAACWRQMEKIDVEIEPAVEPNFNMEIAELFDMAMATRQQIHHHAEDQYGDGAVGPREIQSPQIIIAQDGVPSLTTPNHEPVTPAPSMYQEATIDNVSRPSTAVAAHHEAANYMEVRSFESPSAPQSVRMLSPEPCAHPIVALTGQRGMRDLEDEVRRIELEEARHGEIYGSELNAVPSRSHSRQQQQQYNGRPYQHDWHSHTHSRSTSRLSTRSSAGKRKREKERERGVDEESFLDLLLAAVRVLLSDRKNLVIGFLAALVVVFAARSGHGTGVPGIGNVGRTAQTMYEEALQRQEAGMQRRQNGEALMMMRGHGGEGLGVVGMQSKSRPVVAYGAQAQAQYAPVDDVQSVQHGAQPVYKQPIAPVQPVARAPPPQERIAEELEPVVPVVAKVRVGEVGVDDTGNAFVIPTPPASVEEEVVL